MSKPELLLIGAGGHALACIDVIEQHGGFHIAGLVGLSSELRAERLGYSVIGTDADLPALVHRYPLALIVIGQIKTAAPRAAAFLRLQQLGFQLPTIISPQAYVSKHAVLGAGTLVMHGAIVNADAVVGDNCILNSRSLIEHGVRIGQHCHVATGAILNGDVHVGNNTFIGSGAVVREGVVIGNDCVIGMAQVVQASCSDGSKLSSRKESA